MSHPNQSDWIAHNNGDDEGKEKWGGAHEKWGGAHVTTGFSVRAGLCWTEQQNLPPRLSFFLYPSQPRSRPCKVHILTKPELGTIKICPLLACHLFLIHLAAPSSIRDSSDGGSCGQISCAAHPPSFCCLHSFWSRWFDAKPLWKTQWKSWSNWTSLWPISFTFWLFFIYPKYTRAFNLRALIGRLLRIPLVVNQVAGLTLQSSAHNYSKLSHSLFCPAFSS